MQRDSKGRFVKGHRQSPEIRKKMSDAKQGYVPWSKGVSRPWTQARRDAQLKKGKKPLVKGKNVYTDDWHNIRKQIYERDNWICQECNVRCHNNVKIQCHHIDYDTYNNNLENLITLCASCHMKTNFNRQDWIEHYQDKKG